MVINLEPSRIPDQPKWKILLFATPVLGKTSRKSPTPQQTERCHRECHDRHAETDQVVPTGQTGPQLSKFVLPETNIASENRPSRKQISSSNHPFSGRVSIPILGDRGTPKVRCKSRSKKEAAFHFQAIRGTGEVDIVPALSKCCK